MKDVLLVGTVVLVAMLVVVALIALLSIAREKNLGKREER